MPRGVIGPGPLLAAANLMVLRQGSDLLQRLTDDEYRRPVEPVFGTCIGQHIRHNLDHYGCFLAGLDAGCIDYTARGRDGRTERDRLHALAEITRLAGNLVCITAAPGRPVRVIGQHAGAPPLTSSVARELDFLLSHTIHHYAIVAVMCRMQGIATEPGFGVAPSTLDYQRSLTQEPPADGHRQSGSETEGRSPLAVRNPVGASRA